MSPKRRPTSLLPLKPIVYLIMASLLEGEAHGYVIRKEVETRSGGTLRLDPGTLYRHIARLIDDGLLTESDARPDPSRDDARRRYYTLTALGTDVLTAEAERMAALVDDARARKLIKSGSPA